MGFDVTLPKTGLTRDGDLYQILRNNFIALLSRFTTIEYFPNLPNGVSQDPTDPISYHKDYSGMVHLQGTGTSTNLLSWTISGAIITTPYLFTLPPGFRPDATLTAPHDFLIPNRVYCWPLMGGNWQTINILGFSGHEGEIVANIWCANATFYLNGISFFGV